MSQLPALLWTVAAACLLAGCTLPQPPATTYSVAHAQRPPACTHATGVVALPRDFPSEFPFPRGTAVTGVNLHPDGSISIGGFILSRSLSSTARFFDDYLPLAGFSVLLPTGPPVPHQTERSFAGHGHAGRLVLYTFPGNSCRGVLVMAIYAQRGNTPPVDTA